MSLGKVAKPTTLKIKHIWGSENSFDRCDFVLGLHQYSKYDFPVALNSEPVQISHISS
jgi:hypothetical protein